MQPIGPPLSPHATTALTIGAVEALIMVHPQPLGVRLGVQAPAVLVHPVGELQQLLRGGDAVDPVGGVQGDVDAD